MRRSANHRVRQWLAGVVVVVAVAAVTMGSLLWTGTVHANNPSTMRFPVRGVDVSSYQGAIDWPVLARQDLRFAFLKATEGSTFVDDRFPANLAGAEAAGLRVGAYHFFSFESPGDTQADNVIRTVPAGDLTLPVVVDIWIRDTWREPALSDGRAWTFWQFSDRHRLDGYAGDEPFIDLNVFAGSPAEWEAYGR